MILDKIRADQLSARKEKNTAATSLLTTLLSEVSIVGKNYNRDTTDDEALAVIRKFIKNNNEFMENIRSKNNESEEKKLLAELEILTSYLPKQLTDIEITCIVSKALDLGTVKNDMGSVMKFMKENYNGMYDGKKLASIVKQVI